MASNSGAIMLVPTLFVMNIKELVNLNSTNTGHVLGAAMFMIEIAGVRILYTGDFSRQEDRHLMAAGSPLILTRILSCNISCAFFSIEMPTYTADIVIVESTYGVQVHEPRIERETRFTSTVPLYLLCLLSC